MMRVSMFHRNGFEEHFDTTEANAATATERFSHGHPIWIEQHERQGDVSRMVAAKFVETSQVVRLEIRRMN